MLDLPFIILLMIFLLQAIITVAVISLRMDVDFLISHKNLDTKTASAPIIPKDRG